MSRHTIKIKKIFQDEYDIQMDDVINSMHSFMSSSNLPISNSSPQNIMQNLLQMSSGITKKYYQNTSPKTKLGGKPKYKSYPIYSTNPKIIKLDINNLHEVIFTREVVHIDKESFEFLKSNLDYLSVPAELIINFEVVEQKLNNPQNDVIYTFSKKTFRDKNESDFFDEQIPSIITYTEDTTIKDHNSRLFNNTQKSTLNVYNYSQLNITIETINNPAKEKVVPAIIIYDINNKPLEVHCYYQNEYIPTEIINELKPNILNDDFKSDGYFTERDIECLDMLMI